MEEALSSQINSRQKEGEVFSQNLFYEPVDLQQPDHLVKLGERLEIIDKLRATHGNRTFYRLVSLKFYGSRCRSLSATGLLNDTKRSIVVNEKPF